MSSEKILKLIELLTQASAELGHINARRSELERKIWKLKRDLENAQAAFEGKVKEEA